jgi:hypothetical protein
VTAGDLERGREAYAGRAWRDAHAHLSSADESAPLLAGDLELFATANYMLGRDDDYLRVLERAHHAYLDDGEVARAFRCAFWIGITFAIRGEPAQASGWLGRAERLLDDGNQHMVERGYLLMALVFQYEAAGDYGAAATVAGEAAALAAQFDEADGFALSIYSQGQMLIKAGDVREGLALLDEAMVAVTTRELSPIATGMVYCGVILACQEVYEVGACPRVDGCSDTLVRRAARRAGVHGSMPRSSRGDPAAERRLGVRARRGAEGETALHRHEERRSRRARAVPGS